jgi:hypothetical protein
MQLEGFASPTHTLGWQIFSEVFLPPVSLSFMAVICITFFSVSSVNGHSVQLSGAPILCLKPAQSLSLAEIYLDVAGEAFEFAFDSQHRVRTDPAGELLDRTLHYAKHPFCLISCAEFHLKPPCADDFIRRTHGTPAFIGSALSIEPILSQYGDG